MNTITSDVEAFLLIIIKQIKHTHQNKSAKYCPRCLDDDIKLITFSFNLEFKILIMRITIKFSE